MTKKTDLAQTAKKVDCPITNVVKNEYRDFAVYTVENRAIPSMIDGMKPVQRFYLYSSLKNTPKDFKKVSAVSGVVSDYGYNHGEASAAESGQLMAADWSNHICLVQGRGNFGSRIIPSPGAPRYTYTRVHENFSKYIKDLDLCPVHKDPEHAPPQYYLPILPLVVINGANGIGTGFATKILPRDQKFVVAAIEAVLKGKKLKPNTVKPLFPKCTSKFDYLGENKWTESATDYSWPTPTKFIIKDVPYQFSREKYVDILDELEDKGKIVGYQEKTNKEGLHFEISLKRGVNFTEQKLISMFKLTKPHTENINVINQDGRLVHYDCVEELIKDFVEVRKTFLTKRISHELEKAQEEGRYTCVMIEYINGVLEEKIRFEKNKKKSAVEKEILSNTSAEKDDLSRLLSMSMMSLTDERVKDLKNKYKEIKNQIEYWQTTTEEAQYLEDIKGIKQ